jgi:hypothetical protein
MTSPGVGLARTGMAIKFIADPPHVLIDPHVLIPHLKSHLGAYIARLRDPSERELRQRFERCFDHARPGVYAG